MANIHEQGFCFHPDMSKAYEQYRSYKEEFNRVANMFGPAAARELVSSPFKEASDGHKTQMNNGERYWASPPEVDQYYEQKMRDKATRYLAEHPEDSKPDTAPHPEADSSKKSHWYDNTY